MFKLERNWKLLTPEQRYEKRQAKLKEELSKFFTWCETLQVLPQSKLGRIYSVNVKPWKMFYWTAVWNYQITPLSAPSKSSWLAERTGCFLKASKERGQAGLFWVSYVRPRPKDSTAENILNTYLLNYPTSLFLTILRRYRIIYHGRRRFRKTIHVERQKTTTPVFLNSIRDIGAVLNVLHNRTLTEKLKTMNSPRD